MSTGTTYTQQGLLHQMFSRKAKATPENVAVVEESGKDIKFRNLDENSDKLGKHLVDNGVTPNACVGIYLDKSIEYTTAYIAILKAGAAYLPLDVAYPQSMLKSVLEDAKPKAVITVKDLAHNLAGYDSIIVLEEEWETTIVTGEVTLPTELTLDNLAYIVYSSGTTGKPKGVICPHRGAVFSYHWRHEAYRFQEGERVACNIFFSWEMLRPLLKGVTMYIISNTTIYDPPLLSQYIQKNKITQILFTPSLLEAVLNTPGLDLQQLRSLRQIWFCGEVVTTALFERCLKLLPWIQFLNLYSISECHDAACEDLNLYFKENMDALKTRKFCPVGNILPGVNLVIMDKDQKIQPVGASGEIFVGGPTLAHGYLNRPEVQALRFIPLPKGVQTSHGDRLYRTGDWGYMLSDGRLEICGRCDSMVKIRGYSIEVQAVESALMELPMVNACVVLVEGQEGEDKFLVSYIVPEGQTTKKDIRAILKLRLPFYMIPSYFVFLQRVIMSNFTILCGVCSLRHISKPSTVWCLNCEEGLCPDCKEPHSLLKATRNHSIIPITEYQKIPQNVSEITQNCIKHNEIIQTVCIKHDFPCCRKCIIQTHNNCKDLVEIENYIKDIKSSTRFSQLKEMLNETDENIRRISINRQENLTSLQEARKKIENDIIQTRIKINDHLDKLQADLIQNLYAKVEKENEKIQQVLISLEEKQCQIKEYQNAFENIKKYASDIQLFLSIKTMETNMLKNEQFIQSLIESNSICQVTLYLMNNINMETITVSMPYIGKVEVYNSPSQVRIAK